MVHPDQGLAALGKQLAPALLAAGALIPPPRAGVYQHVQFAVLLAHVLEDEAEVGEEGIDRKRDAARAGGSRMPAQEVERMTADNVLGAEDAARQLTNDSSFGSRPLRGCLIRRKSL
jgi:hypothetical protein